MADLHVLTALLVPAKGAALKGALLPSLQADELPEVPFAGFLLEKSLPQETGEPEKTAGKPHPHVREDPTQLIAELPVLPPVAVAPEVPATLPPAPLPAKQEEKGKDPLRTEPVSTDRPATLPSPGAPDRIAPQPAEPLPLPALLKPAPPEPSIQSVSAIQAPPAPQTNAVHALPLPHPVHSPSFADELASRVTWLAGARVHTAELHVQPPELGPVQVSIRIEAAEASVALSAAHPQTRAALEAALPLLREMFGASGLELGDASVAAGTDHPSGREPQHAAPRATRDGEPAEEPAAALHVSVPRLVDTFA